MAQSPKNHRCKGNLDGHLRGKGCEGQVFSEAVLVRMKQFWAKKSIRCINASIDIKANRINTRIIRYRST